MTQGEWVKLLAFGAVLLALPEGAHAQDEGETKTSTTEAAPPPVEEAPPEEVAAVVEEGGERVEEVVITGSRIARSNLTDYGQITVVDAKEIELSGVTTIDELLRGFPSVTLQGINRNNNNGGNGFATLDLRNLGAARTLILVNGRRYISEIVDINDIPVQMIERVEVLLDGASAVYGSDAIAGVINFILKDDFEGISAEVVGGMTPRIDGESIALAVTGGVGNAKGNITAGLQYLNRDKIEQKDREWAQEPLVYSGFKNAENLNDGTFDLYGSSFVPEGRTRGVFFRPDAETGSSYQPFFSGNLDQRYNYGEEQWLSGTQERFGLVLLSHYELFESVELYGEGTYSKRMSRNQLASQPVGPGNSTYIAGFQVPVTNPYIPDDFKSTLPPGLTHFQLNRRMVEVGNRIYDTESDSFRFLGGLHGDFLEDYFYDVNAGFARNRYSVETLNSINQARLLESADPALCAANAERGCVVGNFFGAGALNSTPGAIDYIRYTDHLLGGDDFVSLAATLGGDLFELPGGKLGLVLGYEFRDRNGFTRPDAIVVSGDTAGNGQDPTEGGYDAHEIFAEASVPVVKDVPVLDHVTLDLSGRWSRYSTFGSEFTYRGGLSWSPIEDIRLRGIYSTAFRAPTIGDLYGGSADSYEVLTDPCNEWGTLDPSSEEAKNCARDGVPPDYNQNNDIGSQIRTNVGGNPVLEAETARVVNAGIVITPKFAPDVLGGLYATFDFYKIRVDNAITNPQPQTILDSCYESPDKSHPNCANIARGPTGGINSLDAKVQNIGQIDTMGLDFTVGYGFDLKLFGLDDVGRFDIAFQGNYLLEYKELNLGEESDLTGMITPGQGSYARFRWRLLTSFTTGPWQLSSIVRYIGPADIFGLLPEDLDANTRVSAVAYWTLALSFEQDAWSATIGVENVLDQPPPFFLESGQNASESTHDFVGAFGYARLAYTFQ